MTLRLAAWLVWLVAFVWTRWIIVQDLSLAWLGLCWWWTLDGDVSTQ